MNKREAKKNSNVNNIIKIILFSMINIMKNRIQIPIIEKFKHFSVPNLSIICPANGEKKVNTIKLIDNKRHLLFRKCLSYLLYSVRQTGIY